MLPDFVAASVEGRMRRAGGILRADPGIAGRSLLAASVLGDAGAVREHLAAAPAAAAIDDERGWPPLLYACYSRWHQIGPGRAAGLAEVVRLPLAARGRGEHQRRRTAPVPPGSERVGGGEQPGDH